MDKPKRKYVLKRRAEAAEQTQKSVLAAADRLFRKNGWAKTTIAAIAREASVSSETIYAVFGSKRAIIRKLIVDVVRRGQPDIPVIEQDRQRQIHATANQARQIEMFSREVSDVLTLVSPLMAIVRTAADLEEELAQLYQTLQAGRRQNLNAFAVALCRNGPLRDGLESESVTDMIWRLASPELYDLIINVEKLQPEAYADWLARTLRLLLLPPEQGEE